MIKDVKSAVIESAHLLKQIEQLTQKNVELSHQLQESEKMVAWLKEQFHLYRQREFGKRSESSNHLQVEIVFDAEEPEADPAKEAYQQEEAQETITYTRQKPGRKIDTSRLPRIQKRHDLVTDQLNCRDCGSSLTKVREDISEQLEVIPRQVYVVEHIHPHYACRHCQTMLSADKEQSPIPKSLAGASLITEVVINKYEHHVPLYRQTQIWKKQRIELPDNTLGNWVMQSGHGLKIMDEALAEEIAGANYLQVDETPVKVLQPEKQGYMWVYLSPHRERPLVRFQFDLTRKGEVAEKTLAAFKGLLQSDGYGGYNRLRQSKDITGFGCLAHARRKFAEIVKALPESNTISKAQEALHYFARLYGIEKKIKVQNSNVEERKQQRESQALPILEEIYEWLKTTQKKTPPQSKLGLAIEYNLKQWEYLSRYVHYGAVEMDTNWVENEIRPFALGRRNWLFTGNAESAGIAALWYSLIQSAKWNEYNSRVYIHYLLTQIHNLRKGKIDPKELLPHRINRERLQAFADVSFENAYHLYAEFTKNRRI